MRLVVVGGVAAGLSAASRARRLDAALEIVVLEKGERISYGACGLPYFIEGRVRSIDDLTVYKPDFFERERNIRIRTRTEASAIRHASRELVLVSGERTRLLAMLESGLTSGIRAVVLDCTQTSYID